MSQMRALPHGRPVARHWPRISGLVPFILACFETRRQRQKLASLDAAMLRDIGMTPEDAREEAMRGFWDVPSHWQKSSDLHTRWTR